MVIQALPVAAIHAIGASQTLTDAASIVKELIENALDAGATALSVEISSNTVDIIQVRVNGHGIARDDRPMICRRHCTSKIRDLVELRLIGGRSLGFRGEALISAAELGDSLSVTTRVEGESVAIAFKFGANGEILSREYASHAVGTTVRVANVFHALPVRRQVAINTSMRCLARIKAILQSYALARPTTRFSLRVLKARSEKFDWIYAPNPAGTVEDAAYKVVGTECAGQCAWTALQLDGFEIQAFLPKPDADPTRVASFGQFLSVDKRPVSSTRGTLRQIAANFRDRLRVASVRLEGVRDPFAWMNIDCPAGSYDVNVEPAKDDVLFEDSSRPLAVLEALLDQCYPQTRAATTRGSTALSPLQTPVCRDGTVSNSFKRPHDSHGLDHSPRQGSWKNGAIRAAALVDGSRLCESPHRLLLSDDDEDAARGSLDNVTVSNPWVLAKMHSKRKPVPTARTGGVASPLGKLSDAELNAFHFDASRVQHACHQLPSPTSSPFLRKQRQTALHLEDGADTNAGTGFRGGEDVSRAESQILDFDGFGDSQAMREQLEIRPQQRWTSWDVSSGPDPV